MLLLLLRLLHHHLLLGLHHHLLLLLLRLLHHHLLLGLHHHLAANKRLHLRVDGPTPSTQSSCWSQRTPSCALQQPHNA